MGWKMQMKSFFPFSLEKYEDGYRRKKNEKNRKREDKDEEKCAKKNKAKSKKQLIRQPSFKYLI